jgi:dynein heavy chain
LRISAQQLRAFLENHEVDIPFKAIQYLMAECDYGGRLRESQDRRLMAVLVAEYICPRLLEDPLAEGSSKFDTMKPVCEEVPELLAPPALATLDEIRLQVSTLPDTPPPGVYGLHANAVFMKERDDAFALVRDLAGGEGDNVVDAAFRDQELLSLTSGMLSQLPGPWDMEAVQKLYPISYGNSLNAVLQLEVQKYSELLGVVAASLKDVQRALEGLLPMSEEPEQVCQALAERRVPDLWLAHAYPTRKPVGAFVKDLLQRLESLSGWVNKGIPSLVWLSGLFLIQPFLTGTLQNFARKQKIAVDELEFSFRVLKDIDEVMDLMGAGEGFGDTTVVHGLFLEGCRWDRDAQTLAESEPKVLFVECPELELTPRRCTEATETGELRNANGLYGYQCPVYRIMSRSSGEMDASGCNGNFVMYIRLPTRLQPNHWVKRGVAAITQLDS